MPVNDRFRHSLGDEDGHVRAVVREAMAGCRTKSRQQIADELSSLLGVRVTFTMLDNFVSATKATAIFPARLVRALAQVTGSKKLRRFFLDDEDRRLLERGELERDLRAKARSLLLALGGRKTA